MVATLPARQLHFALTFRKSGRVCRDGPQMQRCRSEVQLNQSIPTCYVTLIVNMFALEGRMSMLLSIT